jgi:hypothetical protein
MKWKHFEENCQNLKRRKVSDRIRAELYKNLNMLSELNLTMQYYAILLKVNSSLFESYQYKK